VVSDARRCGAKGPRGESKNRTRKRTKQLLYPLLAQCFETGGFRSCQFAHFGGSRGSWRWENTKFVRFGYFMEHSGMFAPGKPRVGKGTRARNKIPRWLQTGKSRHALGDHPMRLQMKNCNTMGISQMQTCGLRIEITRNTKRKDDAERQKRFFVDVRDATAGADAILQNLDGWSGASQGKPLFP
jgi:hypothetical protein